MSEEISAKPESRRERVLKAVLLGLCLVVALASVAVELALRITLEPPRNAQQHVFLRKPLTRIRVQVSEDVPGIAKRETLFTTNALGVRGDELDLTDDSIFKLITLGGSVTECMVLNDEDAWPRRLQDELESRTNKRIWVGNAGRSGEMTLDYIAHAQVLLPAFEPDLVVIMPGGNDLQAITEQRYFPLDLQNPFTLAPYSRKLYTLSDLDLLEPLYAYFMYERLLETQTQDLAPLYKFMKQRRFAATKVTDIEDFDDAIDIYRANLRSLYTMLRRLRGQPTILLMTHPFLWADGMGKAEEQALWAGYTCMQCPMQRFYAHQALARSLRAMNEELLAFCSGMGLKCLDLEPKLPKTLENFVDDGHLKEPGARLVARLLSEFIANEGLTERLKPALARAP